MTDEQTLVDRAQRADLGAFREIVNLYKERVFRIAYDMTGDRHDAEDLSQEVFVRVFRSLGKFRGEAKFGTWLHRIAVNVCYDHRSKKSYSLLKTRDLETHEEMKPMFHEHASHNPENAAEAGLIQAHIDRALSKLSPRERSIFILRHYNDQPLAEIARTLNISEGAVKSMLFRALKRLQKELAFYRREFRLEESS